MNTGMPNREINRFGPWLNRSFGFRIFSLLIFSFSERDKIESKLEISFALIGEI